VKAGPGIGIAFAAALLLGVCGGCGNHVRWPTEAGLTTSPAAPARDLADLLAAADSIVANGVAYRGVSSVYRNFSLGASDHRAIAGVRVASSEVDSIPTALHPKFVWVIHGTETWGAELTFRYSMHRYDPWPAYVSTGAHGGPEWPVGDSVAVVTGIPDSTGSIRLLRCPDSVLFAAY
jgi:hypothetical protein